MPPLTPHEQSLTARLYHVSLREVLSISESPPRALVLGERNPGSDQCPLYPWPAHCSGGRLASILELSPLEYLRLFHRRNLSCSEPFLREQWTAPVARRAARAVLVGPGRPPIPVLALGRRVGEAFGLDLWEGKGSVLCIPHPSGLNRLWDRDDNRARARDLVRAWIERPRADREETP